MRNARRPLSAALAAGVVLLIAGCDIAGIIADRTAGQIPVEPKYAPDPTVPLVVLVENYRDAAIPTGDAERVQRMIGQRLDEQQVAPLVSPDKVRMIRDRSPSAYRTMGVTQIAREAGAGLVIYVDLVSVGVGAHGSGSDVARAMASANVRVIDARAGLLAWPADVSDGYPVSYETQIRRIGDNATADSLRGEALRGLSDRIARLFFRYKPDDLEALGSDR